MKLIDPINFIQGTYNHYTQGSLPLHIKQQAFLRMMLCRPCLTNGKCTECGCKTPEMFFSPLKVDSKGLWAEMLTEKQWTYLLNNIHKIYPIMSQLSFFSDEEMSEMLRSEYLQDEFQREYLDKLEYLERLEAANGNLEIQAEKKEKEEEKEEEESKEEN